MIRQSERLRLSDSSACEVATAVTALFVPGDRSERFGKAATSGADVVIFDLEESVAPASKAAALSEIQKKIAGLKPEVNVLVRVNPLGSASYEREVESLLRATPAWPGGLLGLVVPKAEDSEGLRDLVRRCRKLRLAVVLGVESAAGLMDAHALAKIPGVTRLAFGAIDYALDIDTSTSDYRFLDYARNVLVVASKTAGIAAPLDSPSVSIADIGKMSSEATLSRHFGFGGMLCIHPVQVPVVAEAFASGAEGLV